MKQENLIKTKSRVQQHGEVFTPVRIVREMIRLEGMYDKVKDIRATILEPAVGEGVFLVEILKVRLKFLLKECKSLSEYENKSLLALSTLYGIELLEDNAQKCVMNIYEEYATKYEKALTLFNGRRKSKVLNSAKTIIAANIQQGNFLTRKNNNDDFIVFSEWKEFKGKSKNTIKIIRTEYTLNSIYNQDINEDGNINSTKKNDDGVQISFFDYEDNGKIREIETNEYKYILCNITDIYKEEVEIDER